MEAETPRRSRYRRNPRLERLLEELNEALRGGEDTLLRDAGVPRWPVVFIVGAPRSGTTVVLQWLAHSGTFAYPSNLLARFYRAPYLGARIQQMLVDPAYAFRDEFSDLLASSGGLTSDLGKTRGLLAPNEFWYFWRRFFPDPAADWSAPAPDTLEPATRFVAELSLLERAFGRPFALKAMIANWNIALLDKLFPKAVFLHVRRDPRFNAQSLLEARARFFGDVRRWYSFRPPEYPFLRELSPEEQVAGQVLCTRRAVEQALSALPSARRVTVDYEAFCADPRVVLAALRERLSCQGFDATRTPTDESSGPRPVCGNVWRLDPGSRRAIEAALDRLGKEIPTIYQ
jgi:hypothetical protein